MKILMKFSTFILGKHLQSCGSSPHPTTLKWEALYVITSKSPASTEDPPRDQRQTIKLNHVSPSRQILTKKDPLPYFFLSS